MHQPLVRPASARTRIGKSRARILVRRADDHVLQRERDPHQVVRLQLGRRDHKVVRRVHHDPGHAHVMRLEVFLVDALHHRDLLGVQVHQLHVVLLGQPVVAVVGEAIHHRSAGGRLRDDHIGLADRPQELQNPFQVVGAGGAQRHVDDHIVRLQDDPLVADGRRNLILEGHERLEGDVGAVVAAGQRHTAGACTRRRRRGGCDRGSPCHA